MHGTECNESLETEMLSCYRHMYGISVNLKSPEIVVACEQSQQHSGYHLRNTHVNYTSSLKDPLPSYVLLCDPIDFIWRERPYMRL